jgi:hypothetical protein
VARALAGLMSNKRKKDARVSAVELKSLGLKKEDEEEEEEVVLKSEKKKEKTDKAPSNNNKKVWAVRTQYEAR